MTNQGTRWCMGGRFPPERPNCDAIGRPICGGIRQMSESQTAAARIEGQFANSVRPNEPPLFSAFG